jgi:hypothetical protein
MTDLEIIREAFFALAGSRSPALTKRQQNKELAKCDKLYNYFCGTGEMPYGVAKFRTGEADVWILEKLEVIFEAR